MVQRNDISFNSPEEQLKTRENPAARACAVTRSQASWFLHQTADRGNLHGQLSGFFIFRNSNEARLQQIEIHRLKQALRCLFRFTRIVAVVIKRYFNTVSNNSIQRQLEEMMAIFSIEVLAA
ncbi:hypothetical protein D3C76_1557420 [compost metagenome]